MKPKFAFLPISRTYRNLGDFTTMSGLVLGLAFAAMSSHSAHGQAAITWDAGGGVDTLWSNFNNFSDDATPTGDNVTFNSSGAASAGTVTNTVGANTGVNFIRYTNTGGASSAHTTQINSGATLTLSNNASTVFMNVGSLVDTTATISHAVITGLGALNVSSSSSTSSFQVGTGGGSFGTGTSVNGTLDMSGLSTFTVGLAGATSAGIYVGGQTTDADVQATGTLKLAKSNNLTATFLSVGTITSTSAAVATSASSMELGQTNTIKVGTINIGTGRGQGTVTFQSALTGATATITDKAGTGGANLNIGVNNINATSNATAGTFNLAGGAVTATLNNVVIGKTSTGSAGQGVGTLTFDSDDTITAASVSLAEYISSSNATTASGTINQTGGTANITALTMGTRTGGSSTVNAIYNLSGGTLKAGSISTAVTGTGSRAINWTGGTIQNLSGMDLTISSGITINMTNTNTFSVDSGRVITVNSALGGVGSSSGALLKSGLGRLTATGTNIYTGATSVNAGTLEIGGSGSINTSSGVNVAAGATLVYNSSTALTVAPILNGAGDSNRAILGGSGQINASLVLNDVGDTLSPGNSPGTADFLTGQGWESFSYDWEVNNFTGATAGTDFDQIGINGALSLTGGSGNYILNVLSLTAGNVGGLVPNFSEISQSWTILSTTGGISGFDAANWTINVTGFTNPEVGTFSLDQTGNNLVLSYAVVPEPNMAMLLGGLGVLCIVRRRRA